MNNILETKDLTVKFGGLTAVNQVNISVPSGEITGVIGPNGAGKTTLFNLISGSLQATSGDIVYGDKSITRMSIEKIARIGITRTFQNIRICTNMNALENVMIAIQRIPKYSVLSAMLGLPKARKNDRESTEEAMSYLRRLGIEKYAKSKAGSLPYGQQRRLEIARAIATKPKILLLDEPAAGMNNEECAELVELILKTRRELDLTVLIIEHHMDVVMKLCQSIYVMNLGSILRHGKPAEIQSDPEVIKSYLGEKRRTK